MCSSPRVAGLVLLLAAGCSRQSPGPQRLALLPFENLSSDESLAWLGHAVPRALASQAGGIGRLQTAAVENARDAAAVRATQILYGYFSRQSNTLRLTAYLQDAGLNKTVDLIRLDGPVSSGPLPLIDALAHKIQPGARPPATRNGEAFQRYEEALQSADRAAAANSFEAAVKADPSFGSAWVGWAQHAFARGDAAGARQIIARARENRLEPPDRTRLDLLDATITGDTGAQLKALAEVASSNPQDAGAQVSLAEALLSARKFGDAIQSLRRATEMQPQNQAFWNSLGYAQAYSGDLDGAVKSLREYQRLAPNDPNPLDSLAEVHYHLGRFAEAEKYFLEAHAKNPNFMAGGALAKAAWARLMRRDLAGARELFEKHVEERRKAKDPTAEFRMAQAEYLTGRGKEAAARLEKLASTQSADLASLARSQLAVWSLEQGVRAAAREQATAAMQAQNPGIRNLAAFCLFLSQPPASAAEWTARAERALPAPAQSLMRENALGYALILDRHFKEAVRPLSEVYSKTGPASDAQVRVLLAWALFESGNLREAKDVLRLWPLPQGTAEPALLWLTYPRVVELKAKLQ